MSRIQPPERPRSSSGFEIAPSKYICTVLGIIHSPIMIELGPGANSASDHCPSHGCSVYITQSIWFLPRLLMYPCCCSQIAAYGRLTRGQRPSCVCSCLVISNFINIAINHRVINWCRRMVREYPLNSLPKVCKGLSEALPASPRACDGLGRRHCCPNSLYVASQQPWNVHSLEQHSLATRLWVFWWWRRVIVIVAQTCRLIFAAELAQTSLVLEYVTVFKTPSFGFFKLQVFSFPWVPA
jgi:hypothetical protein